MLPRVNGVTQFQENTCYVVCYPIFPCIFPGLDINIEVKFKSIVK